MVLALTTSSSIISGTSLVSAVRSEAPLGDSDNVIPACRDGFLTDKRSCLFAVWSGSANCGGSCLDGQFMQWMLMKIKRMDAGIELLKKKRGLLVGRYSLGQLPACRVTDHNMGERVARVCQLSHFLRARNTFRAHGLVGPSEGPCHKLQMCSFLPFLPATITC